MPKGNDTRDRIIETTARLLRRQGYHATGLLQIVQESVAPRGSLYHYFPGGKEDLAVEALKRGGAEVENELVDALRSSSNVIEGLKKVGQRVLNTLKTSGFQDGCPVSTVALETAAQSPRLQQVCSEMFARMQRVIAESLQKDGYPADEALDLANIVLCTYEGGLLLARTHQNTWPLEHALDSLAHLLEARHARVRAGSESWHYA